MADNQIIKINRAPVMTLWAAVVAERLGYDHDTALTLGRAVAGLNAYSKGKSLGIFEEPDKEQEKAKTQQERGEEQRFELLGRAVPAVATPQGLRAVSDGKPISPQSVERYLAGKFKDRLDDVRSAMSELAGSLSQDELRRRAYELYEAFRPAIPGGSRGWGANGELNLGAIRGMAGRRTHTSSQEQAS
jgi:hypothetical protein